MADLPFTLSRPLSLGVELELMIVNTRDYNLTPGAQDLLELAQKSKHPGDIKPEITASMIEASTGIHQRHADLYAELVAIRDVLAGHADRLNLRLAGGGAHPFQRWSEQRIYSAPRFHHLSELYGYLAKQFTVFGQHIHLGCTSGDQALQLIHQFARYIPHFIALSAASPFYQGTDTAFASSRLHAVGAFPLSGCMPFLLHWQEFEDYFDKMRGYGIVESMKDFYWDIRPKPEFGTIEIRVCDTPLTVEQAAALAAYAQALARFLLSEPPHPPSRDVYLVYNYNRYQACRFGLDGTVVDPYTQKHVTIREDVGRSLDLLAPHAEALQASAPLEQIRRLVQEGRNGAHWLRQAHAGGGSLGDVVRMQCELWRGEREFDAAPGAGAKPEAGK